MSDGDTFTVFVRKIPNERLGWQWKVNHHGRGLIDCDVAFTKSGAKRPARRAIRRWRREQPEDFTLKGSDA